jgi:hypothetical protein
LTLKTVSPHSDNMFERSVIVHLISYSKCSPLHISLSNRSLLISHFPPL